MENNSTWTPSAPSPTAWPSNAFPIGSTLLAIFGAVVVAILPLSLFLGYAMHAGLISAPIKHGDITGIPVRITLLTQLVSYVPLMTYLLIVVPRLAQRSLAELGIRRPTLSDVRTGIVGTGAMWVLVAAAASTISAITHEHTPETAVQLLRALRTPVDICAFVVIAVVFAPMVEEFAFRVFLFNAISRHTSMLAGALVSGLLFGLVHAPGLSVIIPLALGGVLLATVYMRTKCYWSNVITHALFNAVSVVAVLVFHIKE